MDPDTKERVIMTLKASLGAMVGRPVGDEDIQAYYGYMQHWTEAKKVIIPGEPEVEVLDTDAAMRQWIDEVKKGNDLSHFIEAGKELLEDHG